MGKQKDGKLNWLQHHLPEGLPVDAAWLGRQGYSGALRKKYAQHGWLELVERSVYRRPLATLQAGDEGRLHWQQVVVSLQVLLESRVAVGGRTALEVQGGAHYLTASGPREIHLYGASPPPRWVFRLEAATRFFFHNANRLFAEKQGVTNNSAKGSGGDAIWTDAPNNFPGGGLVRAAWGQSDWPLILSTPERAILELLDEVPQRETFHQADVLMDGLRNLSPRRLQELLTNCRSIKVKRLFFWFAERHNHAWLKAIDRSDIDLGRGKRLLARGGKLDAKYEITVPENLDAGG